MRVVGVVACALLLSGCVSKADQASEISAQADALCRSRAPGSREYEACRLEMMGKLLDVRSAERSRRSDGLAEALIVGGALQSRPQPQRLTTCTTDISLGYAVTNCR